MSSMCNTCVNYLNKALGLSKKKKKKKNKALGPRLAVHGAAGVDPKDNLP